MTDTEVKRLLHRTVSWAATILGSLFSAGIVALVSVLWTMNGSMVALNERVTDGLERMARQGTKLRQHSTELDTLSIRLGLVEDSQKHAKIRARP